MTRACDAPVVLAPVPQMQAAIDAAGRSRSGADRVAVEKKRPRRAASRRPSQTPAGRPLGAQLAAAAGRRLAHDFGDVRIQDDGAAHGAAAKLGAAAYTIGSTIVLGAGVDESTEQGRRVLAHELVHVAQQAGAAPASTPAIAADGCPAEREARELAEPGAYGRRPLRLGRQVLQRQPQQVAQHAPSPLLHPEDFPVYEDWIAQFADPSLDWFTARDTVPELDPRTGRPRVDPQTGRPAPPQRSRFTVLGEGPASHDPTAPVGRQPITPRGGLPGALVADRFIDRPTDDWVRHNLPPELQVMAYQLPADCADIAVILRHVWVFAHGRSETYRGWQVGVGTGRTVNQRAASIAHTINWVVDAYSVKEMVNAYTGSNGRPLRSFAALAPLLHPGDVLVWEHHSGSQTGRLTGGHTQTVMRVQRDASGAVTEVDCLQGNQPIFKPQAEAIMRDLGPGAAARIGLTDAELEKQLRAAPGRRIELGVLRGSRLSDVNGIWTWPPGQGDPDPEFTILMVAGPPATVRRPSQGPSGTPLLGRPSEWIGALRSADLESLQPRFEGALYSARAAVEGGATVLGTGSFAEPEAEGLGTAAGERLWALNRQRPGNLGDEHHYRLLYTLRAVIRSIGGHSRTAPTRLAQLFSRIDDAFNLSARGATTIDFARRGRRGRRLLNILLTGFDPFAGAAVPDPGQWNPSGAAVMQLDGTEVDVGSGAAAAVEGVVLPVSFADFRGTATSRGIVERVLGPQAANVDGVITVSENPGIDPGYVHEARREVTPVQIEQHAAGVHQLQPIHVHPLFPAETAHGLEAIPPSPLGGGAASGPGGPPIITTGADVGRIARETAASRGHIPMPFIGDWVQVGFASDALATSALVALGVSPVPTAFSHETVSPVGQSSRPTTVVALGPREIRQVVATASWTSGPDFSFTAAGHRFHATVLSGPGGDFLSNEVAYRTQRLLAASGSARAPQSFHVHTPGGGTVGAAGGPTPARARARLADLVTTLRAIVAAFGRTLLARSAPTPTSGSGTSTRRTP